MAEIRENSPRGSPDRKRKRASSAGNDTSSQGTGKQNTRARASASNFASSGRKSDAAGKCLELLERRIGISEARGGGGRIGEEAALRVRSVRKAEAACVPRPPLQSAAPNPRTRAGGRQPLDACRRSRSSAGTKSNGKTRLSTKNFDRQSSSKWHGGRKRRKESDNEHVQTVADPQDQDEQQEPREERQESAQRKVRVAKRRELPRSADDARTSNERSAAPKEVPSTAALGLEGGVVSSRGSPGRKTAATARVSGACRPLDSQLEKSVCVIACNLRANKSRGCDVWMTRALASQFIDGLRRGRANSSLAGRLTRALGGRF